MQEPNSLAETNQLLKKEADGLPAVRSFASFRIHFLSKYAGIRFSCFLFFACTDAHFSSTKQITGEGTLTMQERLHSSIKCLP